MAASGGRAGKEELQAELKRRSVADPFQVLGVAPDAGERVIHAAFLTATKQLHPNKFVREAADVRELAGEVFLLVRKAWAELEDDAKRKVWRDKIKAKQSTIPPSAGATSPVAPPAPVAPPPPAPSAGHSLLEQMRARDLQVEQAVGLLGQSKVADALAILEKVVLADATGKKARLYLAYARALTHRDAGRGADAKKELERALLIDPKFDPALAELRRLK